MVQVVVVIEGVEGPVDTDPAAGYDGQQGPHRLVVAAGGGNGDVCVALSRATGPVQLVTGGSAGWVRR
jgi:hypothetical protein